jgi:hypothetical protein
MSGSAGRAAAVAIACLLVTTTARLSGGQSPPCENGVQDGIETDVDCGGTPPKCPPGTPPRFCPVEQPCDRCADGKRCKRGTDCESGKCRPSKIIWCALFRQCDGTCAAPRCPDGMQNGQETDLDCGGPLCALDCAVGQRCGTDDDCQSRFCRDGVCQPPCNDDGVRNGLETHVDCGGPCQPCGCAALHGQCRIFVTSTHTAGNFGGVAAADAICNERAKAAGLDGLYHAWVCDRTAGSVRSSHAPPDVAYVRTDGSHIAWGWDGLTDDGWIDNPITYDEFGNSVLVYWGSLNLFTWTHVKSDGTCSNAEYDSPRFGPCPSGKTCPRYCADPPYGSGWNTDSLWAQGSKGDIARWDYGWTDAVSGLCSGPEARLYCVEQ